MISFLNSSSYRMKISGLAKCLSVLLADIFFFLFMLLILSWMLVRIQHRGDQFFFLILFHIGKDVYHLLMQSGYSFPYFFRIHCKNMYIMAFFLLYKLYQIKFFLVKNSSIAIRRSWIGSFFITIGKFGQ